MDVAVTEMREFRSRPLEKIGDRPFNRVNFLDFKLRSASPFRTRWLYRVHVGYLYTHSSYVLSLSAIKVAFTSERFQKFRVFRRTKDTV